MKFSEGLPIDGDVGDAEWWRGSHGGLLAFLGGGRGHFVGGSGFPG